MFKQEINYFDLVIKWQKANDSEQPYEAVVKDHKLKIRLNDFPDNHMYTLLIDGVVVSDFDDWPVKWEK